MAQFRKRPVVVEASQWFSDGHAPPWAQPKVRELADHFEVETLEGVMRGAPGDWIVRGVKGEIYPCKPDIFAATYEAVSARRNVRFSIPYPGSKEETAVQSMHPQTYFALIGLKYERAVPQLMMDAWDLYGVTGLPDPLPAWFREIDDEGCVIRAAR